MADLIPIEVGNDLDLERDSNNEVESSLSNTMLREMQISRTNAQANRDLSARFSLMYSSLNNKNPVESYQEMLLKSEAGVPIQDQYDHLRTSYKEQVSQDMSDAILNDPLGSGVSLDRAQAIQDSLAIYDDSDAIERINQELFSINDPEELKARQERVGQWAFRRLTESMGERGVYDWTTDIAESVFPLNYAKDIAEVSGKIWGSHSDVLEAAYAFQILDPDEQMAVWEDVIEPRILHASDDNYLAGMALTSMFFDADALQNMAMGVGFDLIGSAGYVTAGIKAAKFAKAAMDGVKSSRNLAKQYKDMGNDDASATATAVASNTEEVTPVGMTKLEAAHTANPIKTSDTVSSNSVDGISDAIQNLQHTAIKQLSQRVATTISTGRAQGSLANVNKTIRGLKGQLTRTQNAFKAAQEAKAAGKATISSGGFKAVDTVLASSGQRIAQIEQQLAVATGKLDAIKAAKTASVDMKELKAGNIPAHLKEEFNDVLGAQASRDKRITELSHSDQASATLKDLTKLFSGNEALARSALEAAARNGKLLDNPELYGLPEDVAELIVATAQSARNIADDVIKPEAFTPKMKAAIHQRTVEDIKKGADEAGRVFSEGEVTLRPDGFNVKYTMDGVDEEINHVFSIDDVGMYSSVGKDVPTLVSRSRAILSPETVMKHFREGLVPDLKFAQDQAERAMNRLANTYKHVEAGLSKAERAEVDSLLLAGDEAGELFRWEDLLNGTVEVSGMKKPFSSKVAQAYFGKRALQDELHSLSNTMYRDNLKFFGMRTVDYVDEAGVGMKMLGRPVAPNQVVLAKGEYVFNANAGVTKQSDFLAPETARAMAKDSDYQFVRLLEPKKLGNSEAKYAVVLKDEAKGINVTDLPDQVLNYKPGYVARIYRPGYWFVKSKADGSTLYAAETREQAQMWASKATEESEDGIVYGVKSDRENDPLEALIAGTESFGGLFTGTRKSKPLMIKTGEDTFARPERLAANDAIERQLRSITNSMSLGNYRAAAVAEWENTVRSYLKGQGDDDKAAALNFNSQSTGITDEKLAKELDFARDYLRRTLGIADNTERKTAALFNTVADKMYGNKWMGGGVRNAVLDMTSSDPVAALKGTTFNLHLGWFNVRQVYVQAMNAQLAVSVAPQHAPAAILESLAMRAAVLSDDPAVWRQVAKFNPTISAEKFVDDVAEFKKSGLIDGIVRQGDWDSHVIGVGNQSVAALRKTARAGQVFFKEGEIAARLIAWNIAKRKLPAGATIKELSDETTRLSMNMSSANAAVWQNNALGVPLQFMQVFAKFAENTVSGLLYGRKNGGNWTRKEAASILAGQIVLFGAVGVPVAEDAGSYLASLTGTTPQEFAANNPTIMEGIDEGALGIMTKALGFDVNFSTSASLVQGLFSENALVNSVKAISEVVAEGHTDVDPAEYLGASLNTINRGSNVVGTFLRNLKTIWTAPSLSSLKHAVIENVDAVAAVTSTYSNAKKAYLLQQVGLESKRGTTLISASKFEDLNVQSMLGRALGMPTDLEDSYWREKQYVFDYNKERKDLNTQMRQARARYLKHGDWDRWQVEQSMILVQVPEARKAEFRTFMIKEAFKDDDLSRQDQSFMKIYLSGEGSILPSFRTRIEEE